MIIENTIMIILSIQSIYVIYINLIIYDNIIFIKNSHMINDGLFIIK